MHMKPIYVSLPPYAETDVTMYANQPINFAEGFSFTLDRDGWFVCESRKKSISGTDIVASFHQPNPAFVRRCSFALKPLESNEDPNENCFDVVKHTQRPTLPGEVENDNLKPTLKPGASLFNNATGSSTSKKLKYLKCSVLKPI